MSDASRKHELKTFVVEYHTDDQYPLNNHSLLDRALFGLIKQLAFQGYVDITRPDKSTVRVELNIPHKETP